MIPIQDKGESRQLFEWVSAKELKEIDWPLCIKLDGGGAPHYVTVCSMEELQSHVSHFNSIEEIQFARPIPQSSLKEEIEQNFKELSLYLDDLCLNGHEVKDAGHLWIAFTDKFNAFKKKILSSLTPKSIRDTVNPVADEYFEKMGEKCKHEFVGYKECCYCGAMDNGREVITKRIRYNIEQLRIEFSEWYFGIKEQIGKPPLAMQIFYWFESRISGLPAPPNEKSASLKPNKITDSAIEKMAKDSAYENNMLNGEFEVGFIAGCKAILELNKKGRQI